jgi:hypothetical protein
MSIRFAIKNTASKAEKESDGTIIRYSGTAEPFRRHSERSCRKIGIDAKGNPRLVFTTGLEDEQIQHYSWYSAEDKKAFQATVKELRPLIASYYGGEEVIDKSNYFFWKENRDVNRLSLSNEDIDVFFDTEKPAHALLYLSILSGAFIDLVAPTRDWAERFQIPHYLALELDNNLYGEEEEDITRSDAHAELGMLRKEFGKDALYILAWCLQYDTNAFGAYNYNTSEKDLINYHIKYIDGKLVTKRKRNMPKTFITYAQKWRGQQTRQQLYVEAYVKAGEYFNFINQREKKYVTSDGTILGNTVADAVKALMQPKFNVDLDKLRGQVEAKWKE